MESVVNFCASVLGVLFCSYTLKAVSNLVHKPYPVKNAVSEKRPEKPYLSWDQVIQNPQQASISTSKISTQIIALYHNDVNKNTWPIMTVKDVSNQKQYTF